MKKLLNAYMKTHSEVKKRCIIKMLEIEIEAKRNQNKKGVIAL